MFDTSSFNIPFNPVCLFHTEIVDRLNPFDTYLILLVLNRRSCSIGIKQNGPEARVCT